MDLWYQEKHNNEVSFGLHVKQVLHSVQTPFQRLDVLDTTGFGRILTLDGLMMCSDKDEFVYHEMIAHIPLIAHPNPKHVLIIGGGDGGTLREVLRHSSVEEAVLCEIDGAVVDAARNYFPKLASGLNHPKAKVRIDDGVAFVKNAPDHSFDVVLVDSTDPIGPGEGLFSQNFYKEVRRIVKSGGIVAAQCESPWETELDLAKVYKNLKGPFDKVYATVGTIPSYPYGYWSWAIATGDEGPQPFSVHDVQRAQVIEEGCCYYNQQLHRAAFALPNFFKERLRGVVEDPKTFL